MAPIGNSVDLKLSSTSIAWEHWHVDTTLGSTRIFGDSGRRETSMCLTYLFLDLTVWFFRYQVKDPISESTAAHTTWEEKRSQSD